MASYFMSVTVTPTVISAPPLHRHCHLQSKSLLSFPISPSSTSSSNFTLVRRRRGELAMAKAGPPSSTSLIAAFVLPLSLLLGTIFVSIRIADDLDEKFLEELAMNKAIMEENDEDGEDDGLGKRITDGDGNIVLVEKEEEIAAATAAPRARNRPRREA